MAYTVDIIGDEELIADLNSLARKFGPDIRQLLQREIAEKIRTQMKNRTPVSTGALRRSIRTIAYSPDEIFIGPTPGGSNSDFSPRHYAQYVEEGGGPMYPNIPNVTDISLRFNVDIGTAYAIAKGMSKSGASVRIGSGFVADTADWARSYVPGAVERRVEDLISAVL